MVYRTALWFGLVMALLIQKDIYAAGDPVEGRVKFYACGGCHSIPGYSNAFPTYPVPRLGRQNKEFIISALNEYRSGARQHGSMEGNANGLSEQDIANIAAFLTEQRSAQYRSPVTGDAVSGKAKAGACGGCHGESGVSPVGGIPTLASQYEGYLIKALKDYRSGKRGNPVMVNIASTLKDDDVRDISAFYASQENGVVVVSD